ncbi:DUF4142 domain-containing protein [Rhodopseudomonas palustris]|uniref:DUF4142 domain-containing protein n=1 Tax=Rhodopseudomonas palustris (strain DX-1) TaxID=652103 RepID=E6VQ01_RHOPX|nr:DUF4142 domain-containing protein [Rhodopseudomonas palustris]QDL97982.1 DUF4142 domain-containing protein [Rhodopseudomonas palustris]
MNRTALALGCLLIATPALAQSVTEKTGVNSVLGIAPSTPDFVKQVAISDMYEIQSNQLAERKGNAAQQTFAKQMITDHTKTSSELKAMVTDGKVKAALPTALDSAHQEKLDKLKNASGAEFSELFGEQQVEAHQDAVSLFERYAKSGDNDALKNWAGTTLPKLQHHLEMAKQLERDRTSTTSQSAK